MVDMVSSMKLRNSLERTASVCGTSRWGRFWSNMNWLRLWMVEINCRIHFSDDQKDEMLEKTQSYFAKFWDEVIWEVASETPGPICGFNSGSNA